MSPNSVLLPGETSDQALDRLLLEQRRQQTAEQSRARATNPWQVLLTSRGVPQQTAAPASSGDGGGWQLQWPTQPVLAASADTAPWPTQPILAASADMAPWAPPLGEAPPPPPWPPQEPQSLEGLRSPLPAWAPP